MFGSLGSYSRYEDATEGTLNSSTEVVGAPRAAIQKFSTGSGTGGSFQQYEDRYDFEQVLLRWTGFVIWATLQRKDERRKVRS